MIIEILPNSVRKLSQPGGLGTQKRRKPQMSDSFLLAAAAMRTTMSALQVVLVCRAALAALSAGGDAEEALAAAKAAILLCPDSQTAWSLRAKALIELQLYTDMLVSVPLMHALDVPEWRTDAEQASTKLQSLFGSLPAFMHDTADPDAEVRSSAWKALAAADPTSLQARASVYSEWLQEAARMREAEEAEQKKKKTHGSEHGAPAAPLLEPVLESWVVARQTLACLRECISECAAFRASEAQDAPPTDCLHDRNDLRLHDFLQQRRPNIPLAAYGDDGVNRAEASIELNVGLAIELAANPERGEGPDRADSQVHFARSARLEPTARIFLLWGRAAEREGARTSHAAGRAAAAEVWHHAVAAGVWAMPEQRPEILLPKLSAIAWHAPERFAACRTLEREFAAIQAEALALLRQDAEQLEQSQFRSYSSKALAYGDWCDVGLYYNGMRNLVNAERAPHTSALLGGFGLLENSALLGAGFRRDCTSCSVGSAYFSLLRPHTRLAAHCGPTNARLRAHLGIVVPEGDCEIVVGGVTRRWQEGKILLFDDSFEHAVHNETEAARLVLIVDMWHPGLQTDEQRLAALQSEEQRERYLGVVHCGTYETTTLRGH